MKQLEEILLQGYESKDLDYKGPCQWDEKDKKACCEIVKDILAMANTLGGYIVIGVKENDKGFECQGLSVEQAKSFETSRLNRFLQNYADPPINALLKKIEHDGMTFAIIEVPRFSDTPHICQKDYPSVLISPALYVRTDTNESAPINSSSDFRSMVENAIRNRSDHMLSSMRAILKGASISPTTSDKEKYEEQFRSALEGFASFDAYPDKNYSGYRESSFYPSRFEEFRFSIDDLREAINRACVNFHGWPYLYWDENKTSVSHTVQDGLETHLTTHSSGGNDRFDFWRLHQSGFFYHRVLMREESYAQLKDRPPFMELGDTARYVGEAIYSLAKIYEGLIPDEDEINVRFRLLGVKGRALDTFDQDRMPFWNHCVCEIPQIVINQARSLAEWRTATVDLAVDICRDIFMRFNWLNPDLSYIRNIIETNFSRRF